MTVAWRKDGLGVVNVSISDDISDNTSDNIGVYGEYEQYPTSLTVEAECFDT